MIYDAVINHIFSDTRIESGPDTYTQNIVGNNMTDHGLLDASAFNYPVRHAMYIIHSKT